MPLDGHSYLVNQGWSGSGTGLRPGAMARPLTIPQKRTLAGVGKDRDEAFPFWDHLFAAAATAIQIDISSDEDSGDEDKTGTSTPVLDLKRTSTGILSNRRPVVGTPATSGTSTPSALDSGPSTPRLSLMAIAKREAAKRGLYSRFFRGPVIGPDDVETQMVKSEAVVVVEPEVPNDKAEPTVGTESGVEKKRKKKRKVPDFQGEVEGDERAERKRRKRELKELEKSERKQRRKDEKRKAKAVEKPEDEQLIAHAPSDAEMQMREIEEAREAKEERRARKRERQERKEQKNKGRETAPDKQDVSATVVHDSEHRTPLEGLLDKARKKKKRRRGDPEITQ